MIEASSMIIAKRPAISKLRVDRLPCQAVGQELYGDVRCSVRTRQIGQLAAGLPASRVSLTSPNLLESSQVFALTLHWVGNGVGCLVVGSLGGCGRSV